MGEPFLCRLGFHRWQDYGKTVEIFWQKPKYVTPPSKGYTLEKSAWYRTEHETVYERCVCKRCGLKLRRKLVTNSDGTLSSIGWELDTGETDKE